MTKYFSSLLQTSQIHVGPVCSARGPYDLRILLYLIHSQSALAVLILTESTRQSNNRIGYNKTFAPSGTDSI